VTPQNGPKRAFLAYFGGFFTIFSKSGPTIVFKMPVYVGIPITYTLTYALYLKKSSVLGLRPPKSSKMDPFSPFSSTFDPLEEP